MKKFFYFLVCMSIIIISVSGCRNSSSKTTENSSIKKIENTKSIVIEHVINSNIAIITDQKEIKELEDLFNNAEFEKSEASVQQPYLQVNFQGKERSITFYIDNKNVIEVRDDVAKYIVKSKQINFKKLFSIYNDYLTKKKQLKK